MLPYGERVAVSHRSFALAPDPEAIARIFGSAAAGKEEIMRHWETARRHAGAGRGSRIDAELMRSRPFPYPYSLPGLRACKAAEFQEGQASHWRYFDRVQEAHLVECRNIADEEVLLDLARELGFDRARFAADLRGERTLRAVLADCEEAARLGIHAVPTVVVGRRIIQGAVSMETYRAAIEKELA